MKKKLLGVKRADIQLDFDLYRVKVPIRGVANAHLSVLDLQPEGATKTIMFLHGYAGVLESWEFQINHFARSYRVVAPDLRGHGQSDAPYTQYTMPELVSDIQAIVEDLELPEQFTLVAHSFGGSIAVEYANAHPERLEKLVLIATAGEFPLPKIAHLLLRLPLDFLRPLWRFRHRWDAELHVVKRMMANNLRKWKGWHLIRNLSMPTLVVTGERDNYFPRYVFDDVGKMVPNAELYDVGSAKHKVQLERHQAVNRAIERFIEGDQQRSWRGYAQQDDPLRHRTWLKNYGKDIPHTVPIPNRPVTKFLRSAAAWLPKQTALIFYNTRLTYQQLNDRVNQFAHVLHGMGVKPGDRVMLGMANMPQLIIAYYATLKIGGIAVMPNPDARGKQFVAIAQQTRPKVLVTLTSFAQLAQAIQAQAGVEHVIYVDIRSQVPPAVYEGLTQRWNLPQDMSQDEAIVRLEHRMAAALRDAPTDEMEIKVQPDDLAVIIFTSGTTDQPKGVCLSHKNLIANTIQTRHWFPDMVYGKEAFLSVLPILHSYGMTGGMNIPIAMGATTVLLPIFDVQQVLEHIREHKVSIFPGVPSLYTAINQFPKVREYGLHTIKACISGAAALPVEVQEAFEKLTRGRLVEGYGLTEATTVTHANPLYGMRKPGSIGVPIANTEAKIVDWDTKEDLPAGQIGELWVRGPQVMQGYWVGPDQPLDTALVDDGWLDTGDVALVDNDGYFQIISRRKDTIVSKVEKVYPRDVEEVLYENNKVLEAVVIGIGPEAEGQQVKAFVVPRPGTKLAAEELLALCQKRLPPHAIPTEIEFRTDLPKSYTGKILRRLLVE
ncbi:MAG: alpha/beta fold hydrolase [Chloroflexi bacterium]|nr:alpha/beta fold hydrolase [Chloroflexota bacterium]